MKAEYDFRKGERGAVVPAPGGKTRITIRLDSDIIEWFRSQVEGRGGGNYQTMINHALREHTLSRGKDFEETLRRVVHEEVSKVIAPS